MNCTRTWSVRDPYDYWISTKANKRLVVMQHKSLEECGIKDLVRSKKAVQLVVNDLNEGYRHLLFFTLCSSTVVENIC